jgi:hypothetical protein
MLSKKDFEGEVNARLIQSKLQMRNVDSKNPARMILSLRAARMPETFSTASTRNRPSAAINPVAVFFVLMLATTSRASASGSRRNGVRSAARPRVPRSPISRSGSVSKAVPAHVSRSGYSHASTSPLRQILRIRSQFSSFRRSPSMPASRRKRSHASRGVRPSA